MATITYNDDPIDFYEGNQGVQWIRSWYSQDVAAVDRINALAELITALPDRGTSVPAPLNSNIRVIQNRITRIWDLDGAAGKATGTTTNSTQVDDVTAKQPDDDAEDGITLSGRGYVENLVFATGRLVGSATFTPITVRNSDGNLAGVPIRAPRFGRAFAFQRNEATNPETRIQGYGGTVNGATWNGYAVDTVLLQDVVWDSVNGGEFFSVRYEFVFAPWGWAIPVVGLNLKTKTPLTAPNAMNDEIRYYIPYDRSNFGDLNIVI